MFSFTMIIKYRTVYSKKRGDSRLESVYRILARRHLLCTPEKPSAAQAAPRPSLSLRHVPDVSKRTRWVEPLASFDKTGHFKWNDDLVAELEKLAKLPTRREPW